MIGDIIAKLPPSWKYFSTGLKHKKENMTVESLIASLDVEQKGKIQGRASFYSTGRHL
jgi:hypothetical protein